MTSQLTFAARKADVIVRRLTNRICRVRGIEPDFWIVRNKVRMRRLAPSDLTEEGIKRVLHGWQDWTNADQSERRIGRRLASH